MLDTLTRMELVQEFLDANAAFVAGQGPRLLASHPTRHLAVVTCMDARIDPLTAFGLELGEAHVLRNAGGVVTDDTLRSLTLSQRALGTRVVILVHHTRCGLIGVDEEAYRRQLLQETGMKPPWSLEAIGHLESDLRGSVQRVRSCPFLPHRDQVAGFVYDIDSGRLTLVEG